MKLIIYNNYSKLAKILNSLEVDLYFNKTHTEYCFKKLKHSHKLIIGMMVENCLFSKWYCYWCKRSLGIGGFLGYQKFKNKLKIILIKFFNNFTLIHTFNV